MKENQDNSKKSEKGISFGALETKETIDRHSSSIDKLTSLVNKLDMKLDKNPNIDPWGIRIEAEDAHKDKATMNIETGPIVKIRIHPIWVEEIFSTITEIIGPTIGIEVDQGIMGMEIATREAIMPKIIEGIIIDRTMAIKSIEIGTEV